MRPSTVESLNEQLQIWSEMLGSSEGLGFMASEIIEEVQAKIFLLDSMVKLYGFYGVGLTFKHRSNESWGILLEDASQPGRYRWQQFKTDGFTGHCTHDTPELCLGDMLDDGYVEHDPGALDRLAATTEWQRGMEIVALIQACNAGQISFEEACLQRRVIYQRYQAAA